MTRALPILLIARGLLLGCLFLGCKSENKSAPPAAEVSAKALAVLDVPRDEIYAASSHLRVVDVALGQVVAGLDLARAVTDLAFTPDGRRSFVAASDGVHEIDPETKKQIARLTEHPARQLIVSEDGRLLWVLEHEVHPQAQGTVEVLPFRLVTIDLDTKSVVAREEIGQRIWSVLPALSSDRRFIVVTEAGEVRLGLFPAKLAGGEVIDLSAGLPSKARLVPRMGIERSPDGQRAYLAVEGMPSRILEIELGTGRLRSIDLLRQARIRGLGVLPDGKTLVVNALTSIVLIDATSGAIKATVELSAPHVGAEPSVDGKRAYFAQTIDGLGGAITVLRLDPIKIQGQIHLEDISPWAIAVRPRSALAAR